MLIMLTRQCNTNFSLVFYLRKDHLGKVKHKTNMHINMDSSFFFFLKENMDSSLYSNVWWSYGIWVEISNIVIHASKKHNKENSLS